jgi:hypothetical protein
MSKKKSKMEYGIKMVIKGLGIYYLTSHDLFPKYYTYGIYETHFNTKMESLKKWRTRETPQRIIDDIMSRMVNNNNHIKKYIKLNNGKRSEQIRIDRFTNGNLNKIDKVKNISNEIINMIDNKNFNSILLNKSNELNNILRNYNFSVDISDVEFEIIDVSYNFRAIKLKNIICNGSKVKD